MGLYRMLSGVQVTTSIIVVFLSAFLKFDTNKLTGDFDFLLPYAKSIQASAWWSILTITALGGLAKIISGKIGAPWVWDHVHFLLDKYQETVFENEEGAMHYHRVTLFRHVNSRSWFRFWNRSGFLVAVERSGHTTMKSTICFKAPDNADEAEGIAGWTWASKRIIIVDTLPDIHAQRGENHRQRDRAKYAKEGHVPIQWLDKHQDSTRARSLAGIPVEVRGRIWGVIVIDSRSEVFRNSEAIGNFWKITGRYFAKLLEKA